MDLENTTKAIEFLKSLIPNGLWVLTAIDPEKKRNIETRTFSVRTSDQAEDWVADRNGVDNLYFSVNQPEQGNYIKKLSKNDIAVVHFLHVDVDPEKGKEIELQRKQIFDKLTVRRPEAIPRPSVIIDSGGGYQAFWRIVEPQLVENRNQKDTIELFNKWLADILGGDNCHNIDRIMRLPWTMNLPNAVKKQAGRVEALAKPKQVEDIAYKLSDFSLQAFENPEGDKDTLSPVKVDIGGLDAEIERELSGGAKRIDDLQELQDIWGVSTRTLLMIREGEGTDDDKIKKTQAGRDLSRSGWLYDVVCELERRNVPRDIILGIITEPNLDRWKISESVLDHDTGPLRYGTKQIRDAAKAVAAQRLEVQGKIEAMDYDTDINELLYEECKGERPKMSGVRSQKEAEDLDPLLKLINKRFTFIQNVGSKPRVASFYKKPEIGNGKTLGVNRVVPADFIRQYNMTVTTGHSEGKNGQPGKPVTAKIMEWWLRHRWANVKERITFSPEKNLPNVLNEWNGFTYPEDPNGQYNLFLEHLKENICDGNEEHYLYLVKWCARMFQKPGTVAEVGLFLKGGSGVGKSVFAKILGNLLVSNFFETAQVKKLSNFNSILRTTVLLFLDEPSLDSTQYDLLKKLMVNDTLDIEAKGYEQETVANCLHIIFASNHDHIAKLDADDRRLCVLAVNDNRQGDKPYFMAIYDQLKENDNAGYKALFHFFRNLDLSTFEVQFFPKTELLAEQKDLSLDDREAWLLDRLEDGEIIQGNGSWPNEVASLAVYQDFLTHLNEARNRFHDKSKTSLGRFLTKKIRIVGKTITVKEHGVNKTAWGYRLPRLEQARASWEKIYGARKWQSVENNLQEMKENEVTKGRYSKGEEDTPF